MGTPSLPRSSCRRTQRVDALTVVFPPQSTLLRRAASQIRFSMVMTLGMLVSGCTGIPMFEPVSVPASAEPPAGNPSAAIPVPGTAVAIHDGAMGVQATVMFGENYMAASGRRCAYYFEPGTDAVAGKRPSGIACRTGTDGWTRIRSRVPVTPGP